MIDTKRNIELIQKRSLEMAGRTLMDTLGIEVLSISEELVTASMPVDGRTHQLYGMLHGGANVALAETLASIGAAVHIDPLSQMIVGQEINANHIRSAVSGKVFGEARPIHLGRTSQVWETEIKSEEGKLISIGRCTIAVVARR